MKKQFYRETKKGVTSLYVVIFATILFGVMTLGFIKLMVSESSQSSDEELSESAYDAAMAGVEDAKVAASQYYAKKDNGEAVNPTELFSAGDSENCALLKKYLYGPASVIDESGGETNVEVKIQESNNANTDTPTEQAYTCVIMSNQTSDYRGTMDSANRVKVIPIKISKEDADVFGIRFSWFTAVNGTKLENLNHGGYLLNSPRSTIPPAIALSVISVPYDSSGNILAGSMSSNDFPTVLSLPTNPNDTNDPITITRSELIDHSNSEKPDSHKPVQVGCKSPGSTSESGVVREFACAVQLQFKEGANNCLGASPCYIYLVASMPYGTVTTDFMVEKFEDNFGNVSPFKDVQVVVDSTGRANDLYRRVETRLSPADDYFPYPQFELELGGSNESGADDALKKNFYITKNCWRTGGGKDGKCDNNNA